MEINERVDILVQAVELAQKAGVLTLDDAGVARDARDVCRKGKGNIKPALNNLIAIVEIGQRSGVYTLRDAYYIYLATIEDEQPAK